MKKTLPDHYSTRMASMADLPAIHGLREKVYLHYTGRPGISLARLRNEFEMPGFDVADSVRLVEDQSGLLVGLAEVVEFIETPVHPIFWITIAPEFENQGLREYLLEWSESRAGQVEELVPPGVRIAMRTHVIHGIEPARRALFSAGFQEIRHSYRMRIEMQGPPPQPVWPPGVHLRPYNPAADARLVFETDEEVFEDHFGYVKQDPEEGFIKYMHHMAGDDSYDPSLWFLAVEGEELVAICICRRYGPEEKDAGYISSLGVKRNWRRQGIAQALLQHAFGEFYRRGTFKVDLGVDAESLTGATKLYKKVGMSVIRQFDMFEKVLRPGRDISVTSLASDE
ncbi:MAG: GNAT family N-acetyltransferase [Anaerolineales bacterium]